jgi:hypothetical protein
LHRPSLVGVGEAFEEYTGDIIDTLEDYPGVLLVGSVFVGIAVLGGLVSGGDGGVVQ